MDQSNYIYNDTHHCQQPSLPMPNHQYWNRHNHSDCLKKNHSIHDKLGSREVTEKVQSKNIDTEEGNDSL